jgi:hypothetical protein
LGGRETKETGPIVARETSQKPKPFGVLVSTSSTLFHDVTVPHFCSCAPTSKRDERNDGRARARKGTQQDAEEQKHRQTCGNTKNCQKKLFVSNEPEEAMVRGIRKRKKRAGGTVATKLEDKPPGHCGSMRVTPNMY